MRSNKQLSISQVFPGSISVRPDFDPVIAGMTLDSRKVKDKYLFVAKAGQNFDGRHYIDDAIKNGASVILSEMDSVGDADNYFRVHESGCPIYACVGLDSILGEIATRF